MKPSYLEKLSLEDLERRAKDLLELLNDCRLCPQECRADRLNGELGNCESGKEVIISSVGPHFGEEPPLVGFRGSGTIFFTGCNLRCEYCQNYDISQLRHGNAVSIESLSDSMLNLQQIGCHNINIVTPTHFTPQIIEALIIASKKGLELPLVYNCGGYESTDTLKLLEDIVDIYMPDIKYSDNELALKYSNAKKYWSVVRAALKEMHRQVGDLRLNSLGIAKRGLLIRHLVLPNQLAGSKEVLEFISNDISKDSYVNIMDQFRPAYHADRYPELNRHIKNEEYIETVNYAESLGLHRGFDT